MLTSVQAAHARRFAASPRGGFSVPDVDRLTERVAATLRSYEGTGTPGRGGLTAAELSDVVLPSVVSEPGYALLEVQDFLDEAHDALASFEQRTATFVQQSWPTQAAPAPHAAPTAWLPATSAQRPPQRTAPSVPLPTTAVPAVPAVRALAAVGGPPAPRSPVGVTRRSETWPDAPQAATLSPAPAQARAYGMDADALVFELQQAVTRSRARGSLQVSVQVPGQQLRVMRVVETTPGNITIIAQ